MVPSTVKDSQQRGSRKLNGNRRGKQNYVGSENHSPHQLRKRSHFGTGYRKKLPPERKQKIKWEQEGHRLGLNWLLMGVGNGKK